MKQLHVVALVVASLISLPLIAQHRQQGTQHGGSGGEHGVGNGHIPSHGPAPVHAPARPSAPQQNEHRKFNDQPSHPEAPHVHAENDHWVGHETGARDPHYHLGHPWEHGHFTGGIGPRHVWRLHEG